MNAADKLHDDVAAVVEDVDGRGAQERRIDSRAWLVDVAHEDSTDGDVDTIAPSDSLAFAGQQIDKAAADRAAAEETDVYPAHAILRGAATSASPWSRSSIRSRTSSRPIDSRINPSAMPTRRRTSGSTEAWVIVGG